MSVRSYLVLLKTSGMLKGKNPCQILNLSQKNIALRKTTCHKNYVDSTFMYAMELSQKPCLNTVMPDKSSFDLTVV